MPLAWTKSTVLRGTPFYKRTFRCDCIHGYMGPFCEVDIDECYSSPCMNGGICIDGQGKFSCLCAPSYSGATCETELSSDFVLHFSSSGIVDHSQLSGPYYNLSQMTLCMWLLTSDTNNYGTPFSYSTNEDANALTLTDYNGFVIYINGEKVITDVTVSDNHWHMICVLWTTEGGQWSIYKDGLPEDSGFGLAAGSIILGNGIIVLGQEQDTLGGGFSAAESYIGSMALVNLWNELLQEEYLMYLASTCDSYKGNVLAWPDFLGGLRGKILVENSVFCQGCQSLIPPDHGSLSVTGIVSGAVAIYTCESGFVLRGEARRHCLLDGEWSDEQPTCERIICQVPDVLSHGQIIGHNYNFGGIIQYVCDNGYIIRGNSSRYCHQNGEWSGTAAVCEEILCPNPIQIANGEVITILSSFHIGDQMEYKCNYGYILEGAHTLTCLEDGTWNYDYPQCRLVSCSAPPAIKFGYILNKNENLIAIQSVTYTCNDGYRIVGNSTLRCSNSQWEGEIPQCHLINCGLPSKLSHGNYEMNLTIYNSTVRYFCEDGFKLIGNMEIKCTKEGKWTKKPTCDKIICDKPKEIEFGHYLATNFDYGARIEYICNPSYELIGEKFHICLHNGSWSGLLPSCERIFCPNPDDIFNGYINDSAPWIVGKIVTYICNPGYVINLPIADYVCLPNGLWNSTILPDCIPIECPPPDSIDNGYFIGDVFQFGHYIEYRCNEGYEVVGESFLKCLDNGTWGANLTTCIKITCGPVNNIENGMITVDSFSYQSVVQYKCLKGFEVTGSSLRICLANGSWSHSEPECSILSCRSPTVPKHGFSKYTSLTLGSNINYSCEAGYILKGPSQRTCKDNGKWTKEEPVCVIINCTALSSVSNGFAQSISLSVNSTATFECNEGYELVGHNSSVCLENGIWNNDPPQCNPIQCPFPKGNFTDGRMIYDYLTYGSTIQYECNPGYNLSGFSVLTCLSNKTWDHQIPKCKRIYCPKPSAVSNGYYLGESYKYGDILEFACFSGYEIQGVSTQICLANGTWHPEIVQCKKIKCPKPTPPIHGNIIIQGLHFEDHVIYECQEGFKLIGEKIHTCQPNRKWSQTSPVCEQILCPIPESPQFGLVKITSRKVGSEIKYTCNSGFKSVGQNTQKCQTDGNWSSSPIKCELISCFTSNLTLENGIIVVNNNTNYNSTIEFSCNIGYKLIGADHLVCKENSEWGGIMPVCSKVLCPTLRGIDHGIMVAKDFVYGSIVEFFCEDGYYIKGKTKIYCLINGEWSAAAPICKALSCPKIQSLDNGKVIGIKFEVGSNIKFVCNEGYHLYGEETLTCQSNGTWHDVKPICKAIFCNIPEAPLHALKQVVKNKDSWVFQSIIDYENLTLPDLKRNIDNITYDVEMHINKVPFGTMLYYTCKQGYVTQKYDSIQCIGEDEWNNFVPDCDVVSCEILIGIPNGSISYRNSFKYKDIVDYKCNEGFRLIGNSSRECLSDGNWSGVAPVCESVECSMLNDMKHGQYHLNGNKIGNEAILECEKGYKLNGPLSRLCTNEGIWSLPEPICEPIICSEPQLIQNGSVIIESVFVGGMVTYSCNFGFELIGQSILSCLKSGFWNYPTPSCQQIICPQLQPVPHSSIESNGWTYDAVSQYVCNPGYELTGNAERICLHNKSWSNEEPKCLRVMCPKPLIIKHGKFHGKDYSVGGIIHYECNKNFELVGPSSRMCQNDHTWTEADPICKPKKCSPIKVIAHGSIKGSDYAIGSVLQFQCDRGFILNGHSNLQCMEDQQWSHNIPFCQRGQCNQPPVVEHADVLGTSFAISDYIEYKCKQGFSFEGNNVLMCNEKTEWEGLLPVCKLIVCEPPPVVENARIHFVTSKTISHAIGSAAFYTCDDGYQLLGDYSLVCEDDKKWRGIPPKCKKIACESPKVIDNGSVNIEHHLNYSQAFYHCDPGFSMLGKPILKCNQDGIWEENSPLCVPLSCGEPPHIRNGKPKAYSYDYLSTVTYFCIPGYHLINNDSLTCGQSGVWIGRKPRCLPIVCDLPALSSPYMIIDGNDFTYKSAIYYSCFQGYRLQGNEIRLCRADGKWSGTSPDCIRVKCEELNPPTKGMIMVGSLKPGAVARFKCDDGYKLSGSETLHCLDNGYWNNKVPNCTIITCKPPPVLENTIDFGYDEDFSYGDRISYTCKDGFQPSGDLAIYCQNDRSWSKPKGDCIRISCGRPKTNNGAIILGVSYKYTDHVMYTCPPGKKPANRAIISCQSNGSWDHEPMCTALCSKNCLNGGTCIYPGKCSCPNGFIGETCQHAVCILPCLNGGTCNGSFSCLCNAGYTGSRCESSVCMPPCENGGLCIAPNRCRCRPGFYPPYCRKR